MKVLRCVFSEKIGPKEKVGKTEFFGVIVESLKKVFNKIQQKLDSKEFILAVEELEKVVKVIFNENEEFKGDNETKEIIQKQLNKVGEIFQKTFEQAIEYIYERRQR